MTTSNRELLELAAKAAGIEGDYVSWCYDGFREGIRKPKDNHRRPWNPLTEDDDALRLAVKLGLRVSERVAEVWKDGKETAYFFEDDGNPYTATRRAIVRAAAKLGETSVEIGKTL